MSNEGYDDFDIDIYGADEAPAEEGDASADVTQGHGVEAMNIEGQENTQTDVTQDPSDQPKTDTPAQPSTDSGDATTSEAASALGNVGPTTEQPDASDDKTSALKQEVKDEALTAEEQRQSQPAPRKTSTQDDRPIDPGASSAIIVSDLQWWTSDNEILGWAADCDCETEVRDVTFCEHKQNGKSKG